MKKEELLKEINSGIEQLKNHSKFVHLLREEGDPKKILTKLNQTLRRIRLLLKASDSKEVAHPKNKALISAGIRQGSLVRVKPLNDKYGGKTFVGFLIGEIALGSSISINEEKIQLDWSSYNPAIFIPEIGEVIYGAESWWNTIDSEEDLTKITDSEIENTWYVKLLKEKLKNTTAST